MFSKRKGEKMWYEREAHYLSLPKLSKEFVWKLIAEIWNMCWRWEIAEISAGMVLGPRNRGIPRFLVKLQKIWFQIQKEEKISFPTVYNIDILFPHL